MSTHVALLRGINVGGGGKLPMADLRKLASSLGHTQVSTYIQTGNVLFTPAQGADADAEALAGELQSALAQSFDLRSAVIVVSRDELAEVISRNPYPDEPVPRFVHGVFLPADPDEALARAVADSVEQAAALGSRDEAALLGRVVYLHTPDGFGDSGLARALLLKRTSAVAAGTARNWSTITKLLALCDA